MLGRPSHLREISVVRILATIGVLALILVACTSAAEPEDAASAPLSFPGLDQFDSAPPPPKSDIDKIAAGEKLYAQNRASCHMPDLSGDPDWKIPNDDGVYPPPPHDATGHT
ncbi:MAG: hypothetical protein V3S38_03470 [Acidimicrobiia bacterium]